MKPTTVPLIALLLLVLGIGVVAADTGVPPVFETQGISLLTSIQATGNMYSAAEVSWSASGGGIITSGEDPVLAGYPHWDTYLGGSYESWLTDWADTQALFPGFTLQDLTTYYETYFPGDDYTLFLRDLSDWASQQPVGGLQGPLHDGEVRYTSTYREETQSNGIGFVNYDKDLRLETKAALSGQTNIEATKEIAFEGINGAEITSTDNIFLRSTGEAQETAARAICVFASDASSTIPRFCNNVEAGSSLTMSIVNARTETSTRFVTGSADTTVAVTHDIRVDALGDTPSVGKASAFMEGSILEARNNTVPTVETDSDMFLGLSDTGKSGQFEEVTFSEETMVDGVILLFDKDMAWESGIRRVRA